MVTDSFYALCGQCYTDVAPEAQGRVVLAGETYIWATWTGVRSV